jgi:hypothetical protein
MHDPGTRERSQCPASAAQVALGTVIWNCTDPRGSSTIGGMVSFIPDPNDCVLAQSQGVHNLFERSSLILHHRTKSTIR